MSGAPYLSSDHKRYPSRPPGRVPGKGKPSRGRRPPNSWSVAGNKVKKFPSGQGNPSSLSRDKLQREKSPSLPVELQAMLLIQRGSAAIAASLVVATLAVYGWTVYAPQQWSAEFKKLATLQRQERHLTATNETLKDLYAEQAEKPGSGLIRPHPAQAIVLPAAAPTGFDPSQISRPATSQLPFGSTPVAY